MPRQYQSLGNDSRNVLRSTLLSTETPPQIVKTELKKKAGRLKGLNQKNTVNFWYSAIYGHACFVMFATWVWTFSNELFLESLHFFNMQLNVEHLVVMNGLIPVHSTKIKSSCGIFVTLPKFNDMSNMVILVYLAFPPKVVFD